MRIRKILLISSALSVVQIVSAETMLQEAFLKIEKTLQEKKVDVKASSYNEITADKMSKSVSNDIRVSVAKTPNVIVGYGFGAFIIRGIQNMQFSYGSVGRVGYQKDGIVYGAGERSGLGDNNWDVAKVQVFKGAQIASLDTPSMVGAINVVSNKPTTDKRKQKFMMELSQYGGRKFGYVLNEPVNTKTALRFSAYMERMNGPVKYQITDGETFNAISGKVKTAEQMKDKYPMEVDEKAYKMQVLSQLNNGGTVEILMAKDISKSPKWVGVDDLDQLISTKPYDDSYSNRLLTVSGKYMKPIDKNTILTFKASSVKGNLDFDYSWRIPRCWSSSNFVTGSVPQDGNCNVGSNNDIKRNTLETTVADLSINRNNVTVQYDKIINNDKLRLVSSMSQLDMNRTSKTQYAQWDGNTKLSPPLYLIPTRNNTGYPTYYNKTESDKTETFSVYGYYEKYINAKNTVIFGGRVVNDNIVVISNTTKSTSNNFNILPSFGVIHKYDDTTKFGFSVKRGYNRGGIDIQSFVTSKYKAEKMWDYNFKVDKDINDKTKLSASVFRTNWTDKQELKYWKDDMAMPYRVNRGNGYSQGLETTVSHKISSKLSSDLSLGFMRTKYTSGIDISKEFPGAPKTTANGSLTYEDTYQRKYPYYVNVNVSYVGSHFDTYYYTKHLKNNAITIVDLKGGISVDNKHFYVGIVNLFNKRPYSQRWNSNGVYKSGHISDYYVNPKNIARTLFVGMEIDF